MKQDVNTTAPLVSIALCTYNGEKYLRTQLDSLLAQTWPHIEIVVTDDVSSDNTVAILEEYAGKHPAFCIYKNSSNLGYNKNFEVTITKCKGEFIAICDQDDIWSPDKIETMLSAWNKKAVLIYCSSKKITQESEIKKNQKPLTRGYTGTDVAPISCMNTAEGHTIIFHKSLNNKIIPFPDNVYYDWWMGAVAACNGGLQWVEKILVWRRIHETNAYEGTDKNQRTFSAMWLRHLKAFLTIQQLSEKDKRFIQHLVYLFESNTDNLTWQKFIFANKKTFFYYKKGPLLLFSYWKNSFKLSKKITN